MLTTVTPFHLHNLLDTLKRAFLVVLCCCASGLFAGCATIVSDSVYPVALNSTPQGAKVDVVDRSGVTRFTGVTPTTTNLESGAGYFTRAKYDVKFSSEGFNDHNVPITTSMDGWYWGNLLF